MSDEFLGSPPDEFLGPLPEDVVRHWGVFRVDGQWLLAHVQETTFEVLESDETYVLHEALSVQQDQNTGKPTGIIADYLPLPMLRIMGPAPSRFIPSLSIMFDELEPTDRHQMMRRVEQAREHCRTIRAKMSGITIATQLPKGK